MMLSSFAFVQCSKDDNMSNMEDKGTLALKVTDAPSDDSNIKGTFVTVSDVKVDGKSLEGFTKQTIEISAYQAGNAKLIFDNQLEAKAYDSLTIVLDYESDASGNAPGCYVLTDDNVKHNLSASSTTDNEISISKSFTVETGSQTSLVVDFDLRRAITRDTENTESGYRFVSKTELEAALRLVNEEETGEISGKVNTMFSSTNEMYVFVYHKGSYNASTETQAQGSGDVFFANAVSSIKVNSDGTYTLAFLNEGDYEVHVASFASSGANKTSFYGMLNASSIISGLLLNNISVSSGVQLELNIEVSGWL